ncbi:ABC transporter substrate-binding protein [Streptomyces luteogriseus]|uniref:ABC transporter substrate-binding protein n=1 Tax=Streptomyces luteogriseus TaxID=68233 RepID=UPI0037B2A687
MFSRANKALLRCAAVGAALTTAVAGCSSGGGTTTSDGKTVLKVVGWKGGGSEPANIAKINAAFEAAHPNIKVKWTYVPSDNYQQTVTTQLLGGNAADVVMADNVKAQQWSQSGNLLSLDGQPWVSTLKPSLQDFSKFNDHTVVLPQEIVGIGLFSNMAVLKKAGITAVPQTWDEFTADLAKLKAAGVNPIGFADKKGWTGEMAALTLAASDVNRGTNAWDHERAKNKTTFAATAGWSTALDKIQKLAGYVNVKEALNTDEMGKGLTDFASGKTAFLIHGSWNIGDFSSKSNFPFRFSAVPGGATAGQTSPLLYVGTGLAINAASPVKDAAKEYLDFWAQDSTLQQYLKPEGAFSPLTNGTTPPIPQAKDFEAAVTKGNGVIYQPQIWRNTKIEADMQSSLQAFVLGQRSAKSVLSSWDQHFAD